MKCAIASFAKTPGLSPVKTRLAADIGKELAETFYRMSVEAVEELLLFISSNSGGLITPFWALAEKNGAEHSIWNKLPSIWTGEGDLGNRLFNVSEDLFKQFGCVILTGTDSPQLHPDIFLKAYAGLKSSPDECIIGPSLDGGFYLFGSAFPVSRDIWTEVVYSRDDTLDQLLQRLEKAGIKYCLIEKMADADTLDDLKVIIKTFHQREDKLMPYQKLLYNWLKDFLNLTVY